MSNADIPDDLKSNYEFLISPMNNPYVGDGACGLGGSNLQGRIAIDALVNAKRIDLIENVLRGYNPGGRVYAMLALLAIKEHGERLREATMLTLKKVINLPVQVSTCEGCIVNRGMTAKDVIRYYR